MQHRSLYSNARNVVVGSGEDRVRLCTAELAPQGSGQRRVLLIHGNPSHLGHWAETAPELQRHGTVLAFDQAGFGRSDAFADGRATLERSARLALALLDAAGWQEPVDLVAQSHGAMVALVLAALAPERVASVVALGTGGAPAHHGYRLLAAPGVEAALLHGGRFLFGAPLPERLVRGVVARGAAEAFWPDAVPASFIDEEVSLFRGRPEILRSMARLAQDEPCTKVALYAEHVKAPVLFVHGADDALVPVQNARNVWTSLHDAHPANRFRVVPGGHMVHLTHPERVNPLLQEWFASLDAPRAQQGQSVPEPQPLATRRAYAPSSPGWAPACSAADVRCHPSS
jgi:pimeloyl-ACP methyl ester carboxylesterase